MSETGSGVGDGDDAGVAAATAGMGLSVEVGDAGGDVAVVSSFRSARPLAG